MSQRAWAKIPKSKKVLRKLGFEKDDVYFVKQMGKGMFYTYTLFGIAWLCNEYSPFGWWTFKHRPKPGATSSHHVRGSGKGQTT